MRERHYLSLLGEDQTLALHEAVKWRNKTPQCNEMPKIEDQTGGREGNQNQHGPKVFDMGCLAWQTLIRLA